MPRQFNDVQMTNHKVWLSRPDPLPLQSMARLKLSSHPIALHQLTYLETATSNGVICESFSIEEVWKKTRRMLVTIKVHKNTLGCICSPQVTGLRSQIND